MFQNNATKVGRSDLPSQLKSEYFIVSTLESVDSSRRFYDSNQLWWNDSSVNSKNPSRMTQNCQPYFEDTEEELEAEEEDGDGDYDGGE